MRAIYEFSFYLSANRRLPVYYFYHCGTVREKHEAQAQKVLGQVINTQLRAVNTFLGYQYDIQFYR